jgi:hypothetical protein
MPHTSVLSDLERRRIHSFLKADGDRTSAMRGLATRCRHGLPRIEEDIALIKQFLEHYEKAKNTP